MRVWVSKRVAPGVRVGVSARVGGRRASRGARTVGPQVPVWVGLVFAAGVVGGIGCVFSWWWLWLAVPAWVLFGLGVGAGVAAETRRTGAGNDAGRG